MLCSQKAAEAAYTGTQAPVEEMRQAFQRRRDLIVKLAKEIPGFEVNNPQGAFYLFPKCDSFFGKSAGDRNINNADDLAMYLLEVGHVACVGGTSFGSPECIRMSYATSDENIIEAMRRIKEALALLKIKIFFLYKKEQASVFFFCDACFFFIHKADIRASNQNKI